MQKILIALALLAVGTAAGFAAGVRLTMNNTVKLDGLAGQDISCTINGTPIFVDRIPMGYKLTGSIGYNGILTANGN